MKAIVLAVGLLMASVLAHGAGYPQRPVRLIVPFPPGGVVDLIARAVAGPLSLRLGQQIVIDNRAGAGGSIGIHAVALAPKDGYTLGLATTGPLAIDPALRSDLPYDPRRDFRAIGLLARAPQCLVVRPGIAASVRELVSTAQQHPGKLTYASPGIGTTGHLAGELFKLRAGVEIVHLAYRGNQEALADLLAGRVDVLFSPLATALPYMHSGRLRVLAIADASRSAVAPSVPTLAETGIGGAEAVAWYGLIAPAGVPDDVIARVHAAITYVLEQPELRAQLARLAAEPEGSTPEAFDRLIEQDAARWKRVLTEAHIQPR